MSLTSVHILLVDDNEADIRLVEDVIREWTPPCQVHTVRDGTQAADFLYRRNGYEGVPQPDLVLLDLVIPDSNRFDVLRVVKEDRTLYRIPVLVFATAANPAVVSQAYSLRANDFIPKPFTPEETFTVLDAIGRFWLAVVSLPAETSGS